MNSGPRAASRFCLAMATAALLAGCWGSKQYRPELDLIEARLTTPTGEYPLEARSDYSSCVWPLVLMGGSDTVAVKFSPFAKYCKRFEVGGWSANREYILPFKFGVQIDAAESWYQKNDEEPVPLVIQTAYIGQAQEHRFDVQVPEALLPYDMGSIGGAGLPQTAQLIRDNRRDVHRVHVAFTYNDQPYAIDAAFRLKAKAVRIPGVPGMP